jgi:predicted MPP superfamily phosphohydrolase
VEIELRHLPAAFDGLKLVQLSDIHVGAIIGEAYVERVVNRVNALRPDIIAITGDLIDGACNKYQTHLRPLQRLQSTYGRPLVVTGNHEFLHGDLEQWIAAFRSVNLTVLRNEMLQVGPIDVAGVEDWSANVRM